MCHVEFDCHGNRLGYYGIYRLQAASSEYEVMKCIIFSSIQFLNLWPEIFEEIGNWSNHSGKANPLRMEIEIPKLDNRTNCRPKCSRNQFESFKTESVQVNFALWGVKKGWIFIFQRCCYVCEELGPRAYRASFGNDEDCELGSWPTSDATGCYEITHESLRFCQLSFLIKI